MFMSRCITCSRGAGLNADALAASDGHRRRDFDFPVDRGEAASLGQLQSEHSRSMTKLTHTPFGGMWRSDARITRVLGGVAALADLSPRGSVGQCDLRYARLGEQIDSGGAGPVMRSRTS